MSYFDSTDGDDPTDSDTETFDHSLTRFTKKGSTIIPSDDGQTCLIFKGDVSLAKIKDAFKLANEAFALLDFEELDEIESSQREQALEKHRKYVKKLWKYMSESHYEILIYVCNRKSVSQERLTDKFSDGDSEKWRGQVTGLSRLCNNRKIPYPLSRRLNKKRTGHRYYVDPLFAEAFKEKDEEEDE